MTTREIERAIEIDPTQMRQWVLDLTHEGHPGIVAMKSLLRNKVWWPEMDKSNEKFCKSCFGCQVVGQPSKPEPKKRTDLPSAPLILPLIF